MADWIWLLILIVFVGCGIRWLVLFWKDRKNWFK